MRTPIRVLIVEDSEFDARILVNTLRQGGYDPTFHRVETEDSLRQALTAQTWDVVLSDYNLRPEFNAADALRILQETRLDLPFIIISGGIGEDIAVAAMKSGAHDYLMKGNLARLLPAVEREMREAATRRAGQVAEAALRESEQRNRLLWENSTDAVIMMDPDGTVRFANPAVGLIFGHAPAEVVGRNFTGLLGEKSRESFPRWAGAALSAAHDATRMPPIETAGLRQDGTEVLLEIAFTQIQLKEIPSVVAFIRDITERKRAEVESRLLQGISLAVGSARDLESALAVVLRAVCDISGWQLGQAWLPRHDGEWLECSPAWHGTDPRLNPFRLASEQLRIRRGEGLPGIAWQTGELVWIDDLSARPSTHRGLVARQVGIIAAAAIPVVSDGNVVAVIEFFLTDRRIKDPRLTHLFSAIAAQLGVAIQQKQAEQELRANEEEFHVARDIQTRLFPKAPPVVPGFDIAGLSQAASAAGGDYFDYLPLQGGRWGFAVGDVTGHGIGPALLVAESRAYLRALAQAHAEPHDILTSANRVLGEDIGAERYITLLLAAIDPVERVMTYANAGHPAGCVLNARGEIKARLRRTGVPLGISPDTVYLPAASVSLAVGDIVFLLTDGIEEAMAPDDSLFGVERIVELLAANRALSAQALVDILYAEVRKFTLNSPQLDDATAVIVKVV